MKFGKYKIFCYFCQKDFEKFDNQYVMIGLYNFRLICCCDCWKEKSGNYIGEESNVCNMCQSVDNPVFICCFNYQKNIKHIHQYNLCRICARNDFLGEKFYDDLISPFGKGGYII